MTDLKTDAEKAAEYAAKAQATVTNVDSKLTAWIKANAGKVAVGVLVIAALIVWKLI